MTTNLLSVIEQQQKALERMHLWADSQADAQSKGGHATFDLMQLREERDAMIPAIAAGQQALEQTQGEACGNCSGSGRMVRDPDIGTDQECFVCNGSGHYATHPQATEPAPTGCDYCTSPLYAGTKCKSCGRVNEPAPSTAGERDRTIVSLPIPASASDLKSDIAELIQSHKYKGLRSIEVLGVFQFIGAEIISGSNSFPLLTNIYTLTKRIPASTIGTFRNIAVLLL